MALRPGMANATFHLEGEAEGYARTGLPPEGFNCGATEVMINMCLAFRLGGRFYYRRYGVAEDFFREIEQVEVEVDGGTARFPIFYRAARMFSIMVPAKLFRLKGMVPDRRFTPAQVVPGVGMIALTAFEYFDTDIRPYNEFSVGIVLNSPYYLRIPGYNLARQYADRIFNVFIYHLPVTTEIALRGGVDFYNYPKFMAEIEFRDTPESIGCELSSDGERILAMSGPKSIARRIGEMKFLCNLYQYRQPQLAEFKINVVEGTTIWFPRGVSWDLNRSSDIGAELAGAVLGNRAIMYMYMPRMQAVLYGPEHLSMPLMKYSLGAAGLLPGPG